MDQVATENCDIISVKEILPGFGSNDPQSGFPPSVILPEINSENPETSFYPEYTQGGKALRWALKRLSGWELPGKEHVEEYYRSMYRRNFRAKTYFSSLTAVHDFLTIVRDSGKHRLEEITKNDIEAFIEHEQDRGLMLSTVRTRLHSVNVFLGYAIDIGVVNGAVLARRIRLKKPETLPRAMAPDDVKQLLSVIEGPRDLAMITVLLRTGMRIGELLGTTIQDIHLKDRRIDIYEGEKNRIGRVVYLSDDAMKALQAWIKVRDPHKVFLFYATSSDSMCYSTARTIFEQ